MQARPSTPGRELVTRSARGLQKFTRAKITKGNVTASAATRRDAPRPRMIRGVITVQLKNVRTRALAPALAAVAFALLLAAPARAQEEAPPAVLDEPVVQVNNDVILLSMLRHENAEFRDVLMKQREMTAELADAEVAKRQPEIIFNLINEILLIQKGKDVPRLSEEIEADVNREVLRVAKSAGLTTLEDLEAELRKERMSLSDIKDTLRR